MSDTINTVAVTQSLRNSFATSYLILMGYTGLTAIEALRTPSIEVRHIMNIETTVSLVAALVYSIFNEMLKAPTIDLSQITQMRYIDWSITTPLIILVMTLFYTGINHPSYKVFLLLITLNWAMLGSGYLGETGTINKWAGFGLGFLFFGLLLLVLFITCVSNTKNHVVFWIFALIWSGYGIAYLADEETKNLAYNGLDVVSKAIFGVMLYLYYGKVLRF